MEELRKEEVGSNGSLQETEEERRSRSSFTRISTDSTVSTKGSLEFESAEVERNRRISRNEILERRGKRP